MRVEQKNVNKRFGLLLKRVFGKNSPVKSITSVEAIVSAITLVAGSKGLNNVASKSCAKKNTIDNKHYVIPNQHC